MTVPRQFADEVTALCALSRYFGNFIRDDYVIIDCETTGFSPTKDYIVSVGLLSVRECAVVNQAELLLDWSKVPYVDHQQIQEKLLRLQDIYARKGLPFYYPWERLRSEGHDPVKVIHFLATTLYEAIRDRRRVVGHNFNRFDRKLIDNHSCSLLNGYAIPWQSDTIFDTGSVEKAIQSYIVPYPGDTYDEWLVKAGNAHSTMKWSLYDHCLPKYNLAERYSLDASLAHTSLADVFMTHALVDTFKQLIEVGNGQRTTIAGLV